MTTTTKAATVPPAPPATRYNYPIGYLRGFIVALVVAHHSALAYHPYAPPQPATLLARPRWWLAFPIVDPRKWNPATVFVGFNDVFFMALMFFLSGLFFWHSHARKGSARFLRDRIVRLGLPFAVAVAIFAPIAYYPAYLQIAHRTPSHDAGFWHQWFSLGQWPAGPAWFIWVLLVFDCIAALLCAIAPAWGSALGRSAARLSSRPVVFFAAFLAVSALAYIPMALIFTPGSWAIFGPFTFQTGRILNYLLYFLTAVGIGAWGLDRGLLTPDGKLARRWPLWVMGSVLAFLFCGAASILSATSSGRSHAWAIASDFSFVLSCAATSFAFLAFFLRFAKSRSSFFDSLSANSYAIYLVHYMFVSWLQYALLPASIPTYAKFAIVFCSALGLSWMTSMALRRIPVVARIV
jgi:peptidoglycan/LPS O-acetylase OafA/YrhL